MVFASLTQKDKEALFALLDEYFESRPELFQRMQDASPSSPPPNQSSHPPRPLSPSRMAGAIQNGARSLLKGRSAVPPALSASPSTSTLASGPPAIPARQPTPRIVEPEERHEEVDEAPVSVSSRIAAAQAAIGTGFTGKPPVPTTRKPSTGAAPAAAKPSPPPRSFKASPETSPVTSPPPPPRSPSANSTSTPQPTTASLVQSRSFGTIDTSSAGGAASTIWSFKGVGKNEKKPTGAYLPNQSAFEKPKTKELFAPPPRRDTSAGNSPAAAQQAPLHQEEEEEQQGEWVVALYDFASSESTDLSFKEGDQIYVTERTSKDWWMAELHGNSGLVPSAYVKPLP